ncbi:hypothetical protein LEP1GSC168_0042 [Leptospira santarosai str. HAI134]|nr:hypothetical protein [Leptospira santarosai]EMO20769.1 hypothetical protein LEP1GSC168_0042 [Leptospira santarosai str. HAI134]
MSEPKVGKSPENEIPTKPMRIYKNTQWKEYFQDRKNEETKDESKKHE